MANELNQMKYQQGSSNFPAQIVINPRNVRAITLRSGKQIQGLRDAQEDEDKDNEVVPDNESGGSDEATHATSETPEPNDKSRLVSPNTSSKNASPYLPLPPCPNRLKPKTKRMEELDKEILNTFKKVEINIPLLDIVRQITKYAKFLKELCTHKRRIMDKEVVNMGRNVSSLIKKPAVRMPQKCKDPGMLDLGASINVMPLSVFTSLHLGPLKSTGVVIQLANHSTVNPAGVLEDVLVRVDKLIFPADFYILNMKDDEGMSSTRIILGRPFMMTTRSKIDVHTGSLIMEIGDEKVQFNVLEAMKHPTEDHSLFCIDLLSNVVNNYAFALLDVLSGFSSSLDFCFSNISGSILDERGNYKTSDIEDAVSLYDTFVASEFDAKVAKISLGSKMLPSVEQPPPLELKPLPSHLKYAYLERDGKLPISYYICLAY